MNVNRTIKYLTITVTLLVTIIAGLAFILSYGALHAVGIANGMPTDWRGDLWPLLTDVALTASTLALLIAQVTRQPMRGWVAGVIFLAGASMLYNVAHAPLSGKEPLQVILVVAVNVWPPLMLVLTTEALRHIVKVVIDRQGMVVTMGELGREVAVLESQVAELKQAAARRGEEARQAKEAERRRLDAERGEDTKPDPDEQRRLAQERRGRLKAAKKEGITSISELARLEGVSETTIRRDLISINGKGA